MPEEQPCKPQKKGDPTDKSKAGTRLNIIRESGRNYERRDFGPESKHNGYIYENCEIGILSFNNCDLGNGAYFKNCKFRNVYIQRTIATEWTEEWFIENPDFRFSMTFDNCTISGELRIIGQVDDTNKNPCKFRRGISFVNNTVIGKMLIIDKVISDGEIAIEDSTVEAIDIRASQMTELRFDRAKIGGFVRLEGIKNTGSFSFMDSNFGGQVKLWGSVSKSITFNNGVFQDDFKITAVLAENMYVQGAEFNKSFYITEFDYSSEHHAFHNAITKFAISNTKVRDRFFVNGGLIDFKQYVKSIEINFSNRLSGEFVFNNLRVSNSIHLKGTNYNASVQFIDVEINEVNLNHFINHGSLTFENMKSDTQDASSFNAIGSNLGKTMLLNSDLKSFKRLTIFNSILTDLVMTNTTWFDPNALNPISEQYDSILTDMIRINTFKFNPDALNLIPEQEDCNYWQQQKEIYRQLKCCMEANFDRTQALHFKAYEMQCYNKSLNWERGTRGDKILLKLNNWSNKHGLSWGQGLWFTFKTWIFFYSIFVMATDGIAFPWEPDCRWLLFDSNFWYHALQFLWLPDGLDELGGLLNGSAGGFRMIVGTLCFLLGKIAIAYGIFQIISAFRKYGKA